MDVFGNIVFLLDKSLQLHRVAVSIALTVHVQKTKENCDNKIVPQVSFFQPLLYFLLACCVLSSAVQFLFLFRRLLIFFSNVNYFRVSLVKFFIGSTNEFSHSYCNLLLTVLRIIFYFWY